jgi:hypothetical protein
MVQQIAWMKHRFVNSITMDANKTTSGVIKDARTGIEYSINVVKSGANVSITLETRSPDEVPYKQVD